jgi:hypothetical protein
MLGIHYRRLENESVEIWADSFHEGVWCCDNIGAYLEVWDSLCKRLLTVLFRIMLWKKRVKASELNCIRFVLFMDSLTSKITKTDSWGNQTCCL